MRRHVSLRTHLFGLVAVAVLPLVGLAVALIVTALHEQRAAGEQALVATTRALAVATEARVRTETERLALLATSPALAAGDLATFYREARRAADVGRLEDIALVDRAGRTLLSLRAPLGQAGLPDVGDRDYFRAALAGRSTVSDVLVGRETARPLVVVGVPVRLAGGVRYVLISMPSLERELTRILAEQRIPADWTAAVLDRFGTYIAAVRDPAATLGRPAAPAFRAAVMGRAEGTIEIPAAGGAGGRDRVYAAYSHTPSGWIVALGVPAAVLDVPHRRMLWGAGAAAVVFVLGGTGLALAWSQRVARPLRRLAAAAGALGRGEPIALAASRVPEIDAVGAALTAASRERDLGEASARRFAAIVESSDDAIIGKALDGTVTSWNPGAARLFGWTADEIVGRSVLLIVPPERHDEERDVLRRIGAGETIEHFETVRVRRDGQRLDVSLSVSPIRDAAGRVVGASKIARDISERRRLEDERAALLARERAARAEAERAESRWAFLARASALLASSLDYTVTLDRVARLAVPDVADGCVVDVLSPDGAVQRVAVAHRDPAVAEAAWATWGRGHLDEHHPIIIVLRTGRPELCEDATAAKTPWLAHDPGHARLLERAGVRSYLVVPLRTRGAILGALSLVRDRAYTAADLGLAEELAQRVAQAIDNARLYRESQAANEAKDEFLAVLSHELRTPLNAVLGWARMLQSGQLDDATARRAVQTIVRSANAQLQLIDDLLDVSRIIAGKMRLDVRAVDLRTVVEAAVDAVRPAADARAIRLQCVLDPNAGPVTGDPARLQQVVWNLVMNAVKFTDRGGRVQVHLMRIDSHVEIVVSDTGRGIAADVLPFIFERFRQADSSSTRAHGGLGLGLALVKQLVELHGGTVSAESPGEGRGATFIVRLPLTIAEPSAVGGPRRHPTAIAVEGADRGAHLDGVRVLLVDDDADALELASTILRRAGAVVRGARSAGEALTLLREWLPDVLVSDIEMPEEDGYGLIRRVRTLDDDRARRTPAVALTAYGRTEDRIRTLNAGYNMHVPKPVDPGELTTIVASLIERGSTPAAG